jgi:hypothetical protein
VRNIRQHPNQHNGPRFRAPSLEIAETIQQLKSILWLRPEHPEVVTYRHFIAVRTAIAIIEAYRDQLLDHPAADPVPARDTPSLAPTR